MSHRKHGHNAAHSRELAKKQKRPSPDVVFVTLPPDFEGPIGGFYTQRTPGVGPPMRATRHPQVRPTRRPQNGSPRSTPKGTSPTSTPIDRPKMTKNASQPSKPSQTTMATSPSDNADPISSPTGFELRQKGTDAPTGIPSSSGSGGMSGGAKAGLAIGIILLVGLIAGAALFFIRKKKRQDKAELARFDNEKPFGAAASSGSGPGPTNGSYDPPSITRTLTSPTAPQLNIRPITQFSPDFGAGPTTTGNAFGGGLAPSSAAAVVVAAGAARNLTGEKPAPPPKMSNNDPNPFNDPVNPFDSPPPTSLPPTPATPAPMGPNDHMPSPAISDIDNPSPETMGTGVAAVGTAVAAGAVGAVAVRRSLNDGKPQALPLGGPGPASDAPPPDSPAISMDSATAAAVAGAGAGAGAGAAGPLNVHRVQLDFVPSMEDELELRAGQLVRLVHEYDDGWALCVRLDRSGQGVVPRTCLSSRPVRPRPRNQSSGQGSPGPRGPPPMGHHHGSYPSDGGRSMSMSSQISYHGPNPNQSGPSTPRFQPPANGRPASPASPAQSSYRTFPPQSPHPHPHHPNHPHHQSGRSMSPARFPPVPRSLSPGPGRIPQPRSMSPGPYGPGGMTRPHMSASAHRRRSHSTSAAMRPGNNAAPLAPQGQGQQRQQQQQFALPSATAGFGGYSQQSPGVPAQSMLPQQQQQPKPQPPVQQPQVQVQTQAPMQKHQVSAPAPTSAPAVAAAPATPKPSRSPPMPTGPIERKPLPNQAKPENE
ncbi:SH3 domain-containing protein [Histoplasma capsulatum]|uniref:SH3 domain-containing protein n=1 Tax=Ajellomyces capsulatus TaxID=5037 RepID=A0A8A1M5T5_AJECA|nr:predicted protein [Histoplasma mississippiense (nom. inval.)]EDN09521.1 predicted protein [Histoplasma mississippiense (nom. inval.)]QSS60113.1 SH3 domain-containing protein [Histoplasma capsulatum]